MPELPDITVYLEALERRILGRTLLRQNRFAEAEVETLAGYNIVIKQASPATTFVHAGRTDLVAEYDALKQSEKAAQFRALLAEQTQK